MKRFSVFWGCTIPARFPFIEKSSRLVIEDLGGELVEVDGFTCCPERTLIKALDEEAFYLTAARNLALAEMEGLALLTPCSGCYSTFRSVEAELKVDWRRRRQITELLDKTGLALDGGPPVKHLVEWLYDEVGPAALAKQVGESFWGMRLAVHYGCHLLRPSPSIRWDSSTEPTKLEDLIKALGATVVEYETKMECCGGALDRVGERDGALELCRRKLDDLRRSRVDGLVVVCPSCFQQFDINQAVLKRRTGEPDLPVFYYTELLALALGHGPEEVGLGMHRVGVEGFLACWASRREDRRAMARDFNVEELEKCHSCRACEADCPVTRAGSSFSPTGIIGEILSGDLDGVIERGELWKCLECFTCYELCHSQLGMAEVFRTLKELAASRGRLPEAVQSAWATFLATGSLGEPRQGARRKLGLGPLAEPGGEDLLMLLGSSTGGRRGKPV